MAEIGEVIGVCESRVSQLRSLALVTAAGEHAGGARQGREACMSKILSQEEIDALLTSAAEIERSAKAAGRGPVVRRESRRLSTTSGGPDRVSKDQIRSLHFLHDRFARNVATAMSAYLRTGDRRQHPVGRAVHLLRVPDVVAGPDGVLRAGHPADRRVVCARDEPERRVHDDRPDARRAGPRRRLRPARSPRSSRTSSTRSSSSSATTSPRRGTRSSTSTSRSAAVRRARRCCRSRRRTRSSCCWASTSASAKPAACSTCACRRRSSNPWARASPRRGTGRGASRRRRTADTSWTTSSRVKLRVSANLDTTLPARELLVLAPGRGGFPGAPPARPAGDQGAGQFEVHGAPGRAGWLHGRAG